MSNAPVVSSLARILGLPSYCSTDFFKLSAAMKMKNDGVKTSSNFVFLRFRTGWPSSMINREKYLRPCSRVQIKL